MDKQKKNLVIQEFVGVFGFPGVYLMDFKGLNVAEITELRGKLRESNVSMRVVKNTLAKRALVGAGIKGFDSYFTGPTGIVWSRDDSIIPARLLTEFLKKHTKASLKAGLIDGMVVEASRMDAVSKLPTKRELQARVAAALNAPIIKLAQVLNAVPSTFVRTLDALLEQKRAGQDS
jgi:large subunit ribosomal protein L10